MMNALLNKFDSVVIEIDTRISETDKAFCERQEKMYREAIQAMQQTLELFKGIFEAYPKEKRGGYSYKVGFIDDFKDIRHIEDRIKDFKNSFISDIVSHFQGQYNVSLNSEEIRHKYKEIEVTYQDIIDCVFDQLGGFNFKEKAIKEIKDKCRETVYNDSKITIKKGKLSIQDFVWWDGYAWENEKRLGWGENKVRPLFKGLSHFETGSTDTLNYYACIYAELKDGDKKHDIFTKYELGYNKVKTIKFYKNGKIDIEFQTMQQAEEFKNEYLIN